MKIIGVDPGISGGVVLLDTEACSLTVADMPTEPSTKGRRLASSALLTVFLHDVQPDHIFLEEVGVRPGEGAVGAFSFGRGLGRLEGVAAGTRTALTTVTPQEWKRVTKTPADKKRAIARAYQLFPRCVKLFQGPRGGEKDGRAEAALIAFYGAMKLGVVPKAPIEPAEFPA
ncbi:Holliday junction resolvase [Caulobacter phage CcrRogue]|uniref:Putative RNaseH-like domain protein n=1 Tax=Caulobacter phage CcrRogue TaxID=2927986 RepID=K4JNK5_9CAUD|nr:Holliday junction resolvase [Caulobacter phage CcrRogue]AFU86809.1 putative RNaseH-like domain protein [Caulobacter phage CcrRogue]